MAWNWRGFWDLLTWVAGVVLNLCFWYYLLAPPLHRVGHPVLLVWRWLAFVSGPMACGMFWTWTSWRKQFRPETSLPQWNASSLELRRWKGVEKSVANVLGGSGLCLFVAGLFYFSGSRWGALARPFADTCIAAYCWFSAIRDYIGEREFIDPDQEPGLPVRSPVVPLRSEHWGEARHTGA